MENLQQNYETHKARFLDIMQCKNEQLKKMRLEGLENDMQACYDIPQTGSLRIGAFINAYPGVYSLFTKVKEARWT